jgi:hypothetical protein
VIDDEWLARPAVRPVSAAALRPFLPYNEHRPYEEQIKPFGFLIAVQVWHPAFSVPAGYPPQRFQLMHPWEPDPRLWLGLEWIDHYSGHAFRIHTTGPPSPRSVKVKTNQDVLDRYRSHPEPKSLAPRGVRRDPFREATNKHSSRSSLGVKRLTKRRSKTDTDSG